MTQWLVHVYLLNLLVQTLTRPELGHLWTEPISVEITSFSLRGASYALFFWYLRSVWRAESVEHVSLDLRVMSWGPTSGIELVHLKLQEWCNDSSLCSGDSTVVYILPIQSAHLFFFSSLFLRERASMSGGGAENPMRDSNPQTARSWPELKSDAQLTEPPRCPCTSLFKHTLFNHLRVGYGSILILLRTKINY